MKRPDPLYRIHDSTPIHARRPDSEAWQTFRIARKTANSVFIATPADARVLARKIAGLRTTQAIDTLDSGSGGPVPVA